MPRSFYLYYGMTPPFLADLRGAYAGKTQICNAAIAPALYGACTLYSKEGAGSGYKGLPGAQKAANQAAYLGNTRSLQII